MKQKLAVYKVFIASILILGLSYWFTQLNNASFNRLSHNCVENIIPDVPLNTLRDLGYISQQEAAQEQKYCEKNFHPEIKDSWKTVNSYTTGLSLLLIVPIFLCTGIILVFRWIKKTI